METQEAMDTRGNQSENWKAFTKLFIILALPLIDLSTDVYTIYMYFEPSKSLLMKAFYISLFVTCFHNAVSIACGLTRLKALHHKKKLAIWGSTGWKCLTVISHTLGVGGILVPLEAILSCQKFHAKTILKRLVYELGVGD